MRVLSRCVANWVFEYRTLKLIPLPYHGVLTLQCLQYIHGSCSSASIVTFIFIVVSSVIYLVVSLSVLVDMVLEVRSLL